MEITAATHGGRRPGAGRKPGTESVGVDVRTRLVVARAEKEEALAKLASLEVAEKEGRLIDAAMAARDSRRAGMAVRDAVLSVPGRIAAQLVGMADEREIERVLTAALREELTRVASLVKPNAAG